MTLVRHGVSIEIDENKGAQDNTRQENDKNQLFTFCVIQDSTKCQTNSFHNLSYAL